VKSAGLQAIEDGVRLGAIIRSLRRMDGGTTTVEGLAADAFAKAEPVVPYPLEENGIIVGGLLVVRGEKNFLRVQGVFECAESGGKA